MRKVTLTVVGIAGLSLLLCGSDEVLAQTDRTASPPGAAGSDAADSRVQATGTEQAAGGAGASPAELRQSVLQLQGEVAQLRQELAQVRAELANLTANTGVGGSGQAGVAPAAASPGAGEGQNTAADRTSAQGMVSGSGTAGQGTTPRAGTNPGTAQRGTQARDTDNSGEAVVNAIYTGKVRSVSNRQLVLLDDSGQPFTVELGAQTRFISKGQRISAQQLKQGTRVRATVDMLSGRNQATEVTTLP
jgi:hypothetical protein